MLCESKICIGCSIGHFIFLIKFFFVQLFICPKVGTPLKFGFNKYFPGFSIWFLSLCFSGTQCPMNKNEWISSKSAIKVDLLIRKNRPAKNWVNWSLEVKNAFVSHICCQYCSLFFLGLCYNNALFIFMYLKLKMLV